MITNIVNRINNYFTSIDVTINKKITIYAAIITSLYAIFTYINLSYHELWRDELQAWEIARSAHNIKNLYNNLSYEANAGLWHLILFFVSRFSYNPILMQYTHLIIASLSVYIFIRYSPFDFIIKVLYPFGYYIAYEYSIISRHYSLTLLLSIIFCILCTNIYKNRIYLPILILLISMTSIHGILISIGFIIYFITTSIKLNNLLYTFKKNITYLLLMICGIIFPVLISFPPKDFQLVNNNQFSIPYIDINFVNIRFAINKIFESYIAIPDNVPQFWNINIIQSPNIKLYISILLIITAIIFLSKKIPVVIYFVASNLLFLVFFYTKYIGVARHYGHLFIVFICSFWLLLSHKKNNYKIHLLSLFIYGILILQVIGSSIALKYEWQYEFDHGESVTKYIYDNNLDQLLIAGERDTLVSTISMLLNRKVYYLRIGKYGSFIYFNKKRQDYDEKNTLDLLKEFTIKNKKDVLAILSFKPEKKPSNMIFLKKFSTSIYPEKYYLYLYKYIN